MEFSFFLFLSLNFFTFNALPSLNFSITPNFSIPIPSSIKNDDLDLASLNPEGYVFSWVEKIDSNTSFLPKNENYFLFRYPKSKGAKNKITPKFKHFKTYHKIKSE